MLPLSHQTPLLISLVSLFAYFNMKVSKKSSGIRPPRATAVSISSCIAPEVTEILGVNHSDYETLSMWTTVHKVSSPPTSFLCK